MSDIVPWRERVEEEKNLDMDEICEAVSSGVSLARYCNMKDLKFSTVRRWIEKDAKRKAALADAKAVGDDMVRQIMIDMVLNLCRFNPQEILGPDGKALPMDKWPDHVLAAVEQIDVNNETGDVSVKFTPRSKAFDMVGKMAGLFKIVHEHKADKSFSDYVLESMKGEE